MIKEKATLVEVSGSGIRERLGIEVDDAGALGNSHEIERGGG
jgi:hypothetical protein